MKLKVEQAYLGWYAYDDDTYDVDCDEGGYYTTSPMGMGDTVAEAVDDLLTQIKEEEE